MHNVSLGMQLKAISNLSTSDGVRAADIMDIDLWARLAGPKFDTRVLSDLTLERINSLYNDHFE